MEQKFKKLFQKTKAHNEAHNEQRQGFVDPLFKSFEGGIFKDSSWFFHFLDREIPVVASVDYADSLNRLQVVETAVSTSLIEVLFVGDTYAGEGEDLLGKMINAMKLNESEFARLSMDEELDNVIDLTKNLENPSINTQKMLDVILEKRPRFVVSLGATVANILLGRREKMSTIHGQFFEQKIGEYGYHLMPLFHPTFLIINPNMKRTAWIDLQKIMERMGKN